MSTETIQITPNNSLKTNWVKQIYFYVVLAFALLFFCIGLFTASKAILIRFVFQKADTNSFGMYGPYNNPELQCKNGQGSQYYSPKVISISSSEAGKPLTPLGTSESEIKDCIEATNKGIDDQKERSYQSDVLLGILTLVISAIVGGIHYAARGFFLKKE